MLSAYCIDRLKRKTRPAGRLNSGCPHPLRVRKCQPYIFTPKWLTHRGVKRLLSEEELPPGKARHPLSGVVCDEEYVERETARLQRQTGRREHKPNRRERRAAQHVPTQRSLRNVPNLTVRGAEALDQASVALQQVKRCSTL